MKSHRGAEGPDRAGDRVLADPEVAEVILAGAAAGGIRHLWFVSGSDLTCFQEAAAKATHTGAPAPRLLTMMHEHVALCAAMGETMLAGRPSMTAAHADLGLLHHGGAIHNAFRGNYPVMMMSGYPASTRDHRQRPAYWKQQRWDQGSIVRQYVKWDHKLAPYDHVPLVVARAIQVMLAAPRGPSYLVVPAEVGSHRLNGQVRPMAGSRLGVPAMGGGDSRQIKEIASRILEAEDPLIITDRIGNDPAAVPILDRICEAFAVSVEASRLRMNLRDDHPARFGTTAVEDADVILVLESHVPWIPARAEPRSGAWVVAVGTDPAALEIPIYEFEADMRLTVDPATFLLQLEDELLRLRKGRHAPVINSRWQSFIDATSRHQKATARTLAKDRASSKVTESLISHAIGELMEPEDILTSELGDTTQCRRSVPGTMFESGGSSLGWAVAAAAGSLVNDRSRTAVCLTGDGSYSFGSPDSLLWTQLQHDLPVLTVVFNNRGYRTGTTRLLDHYPDGYSARNNDLTGGLFDPPPRYAAEAEAAGAFGRQVESPAELFDTLKKARASVVQDRVPAVVDVRLPEHVSGRLDSRRP